MKKITRTEFITDLEALELGNFSCRKFREKYFPIGPSNVDDLTDVPDLVGTLSHYLDDEDWRKRDKQHNDMQHAELHKLIKLLKSSASDSELKKIHFLGKT